MRATYLAARLIAVSTDCVCVIVAKKFQRFNSEPRKR